MRKKMVKLALGLAVLGGSLTAGLTPKVAEAAGYCADICCDRFCSSVRKCFYSGGRCICSQYCEPAGPILD